MSDSPRVTSLDDEEILARFVMFRDWVRADGTVRPDAFMPPKDLNLSTTRHTGLTEAMIWSLGREVSAERKRDLLGRADMLVRTVSSAGLSAESSPLPRNPNHAHITGWPQDKPSQKILAEQLAAASEYCQHRKLEAGFEVATEDLDLIWPVQ